MYLKRLEMQGFKSFVDKTVLEFDKGITAIVGPNGSGKSNISDAVKWVLGEQSPKTLRGSKMEDIIFAGTQNRKPVGMAEVSLIMDNEDHTLNIDFLEVRITRRLYRSGESEYLINGAQCRLKDILMLFADTGIGRDGYSIIGQGRIDEVLNNKSEDRRSIFEDASGIMKYRMRKVESERKLASTEQNLLRINDIVRELEAQIKPLEKQSEVAKKYLGLKYALRDIEVGVLTEAIDNAGIKLEEVTKQIDILSADKIRREAMVAAVEGENREKTELSKDLGEKLSMATELVHEHEKRIEHIQGEIALNNEKIASSDAGKQRADEEIAGQAGRIAAFEADIKRIEGILTEIESEIDAINKEGAKKADEFADFTEIFEKKKAETAKKRAELVNLRLKENEKRVRSETLEKANASALERKNVLEAELSALSEGETLGLEELRRAEKEADEKADLAQEAKQEYRNKAEQLAILRSKADENTRKITEITGKMRSAEAQLKLLKEMEEGFEGYARSVKEVLQMCKKNPSFGSGIYGAVAQLFTVAGEYELAIETALGQSYQNIITESERETKAAIEFLKENKYGRATFMPVTAANGRRLEDNIQKELRGIPGYLGIASDRVDCEDKFRPIADSLLGRVALFKNLDSAMTAAKAHHYGFMCVTLEGDILRTTGAITGGSVERSQKTVGALSRTREIPKLEKELKKAGSEIETLMAEMNEAKNRCKTIENEQTEQFELMKTLESEATALNAKCAALRERQEGRKERREKLIEDLKSQISDTIKNREEIDSIVSEEENIKKLIEESEKQIAKAEDEERASGADVDEAGKAAMALKIRENECLSRKRQNENDILRIRGEIRAADERTEQYRKQISETSGVRAELLRNNGLLEKQMAVSKLDAENASRKAEQLKQRKADVDESLGGMISRITEINADLARINEENSRLEIQKVKAENEINSSKNRLWEEYELTYTAAKEMAGGIKIENYKEATKQINELRASIKALGPVNVNAVEEYESTLKRYEFMSAQSKDMNDARLKLQKVVNELTDVMQKQFIEQFQIIRKNFSVVFSELFGGGKADIVLADEKDVLECGIEINVQPPGKKLQNMMLLSGGERALTAIALLFGILRMRPSPFCLLDEIEAALDDANVYRLSDYLENVAKKTQFIMVTHRKGTMENAESLYGVTMEEKGVSKVVSLKMDE